LEEKLVFTPDQSIYDDEDEFDDDKTRFTAEGFLSESLLRYILCKYQLKQEQFDFLIGVMKHHNLCHSAGEQEIEGQQTLLYFPWFSPKDCPCTIEAVPGELVITLVFSFFLYLPATVYEQFVVRCLHQFDDNTSDRVVWKDGVYIDDGDLRCVMKKSEMIEDQSYPNISVQVKFLPEHIGKAWTTCSCLAKEMYVLLEKVPHLPKNAYYVCAHCVLHNYEIQEHHKAKLLLNPDKKGKMTGICKKHKRDKSVPNLLLVPLDQGILLLFMSYF